MQLPKKKASRIFLFLYWISGKQNFETSCTYNSTIPDSVFVYFHPSLFNNWLKGNLAYAPTLAP